MMGLTCIRIIQPIMSKVRGLILPSRYVVPISECAGLDMALSFACKLKRLLSGSNGGQANGNARWAQGEIALT